MRIFSVSGECWTRQMHKWYPTFICCSFHCLKLVFPHLPRIFLQAKLRHFSLKYDIFPVFIHQIKHSFSTLVSIYYINAVLTNTLYLLLISILTFSKIIRSLFDACCIKANIKSSVLQFMCDTNNYQLIIIINSCFSHINSLGALLL